MALKTNTESPILPQEIVELILDEVAALKSPETLRACALVSKSFCFPSRRRLYSDILLVVDRYGQARARRLIKTLETFRKGGFTADVRSHAYTGRRIGLNLYLDPLLDPEPSVVGSRRN